MTTDSLTSSKSSLPPSPPAEEVPTIVIKPTRGLASLQLRDLWHYRELLYFLVWRDVKVRYKQTALGIVWVLLQPLLSTVVFTVLFGVILGVQTGNVPYPVFALAGLVPWQYFAGSLNRGSTNLVNSANLITKVYFPRLVIPLSSVLSGLVDFAVGFGAMIVLMLIYRVPLTWNVLLLPFFLLLALATALGFSLWLSALNVKYRDVKYVVPFMVQIWMYLTPVIYPVTIIPQRFRPYLALNPMTGVVEGFRWALLGETGAQAPGGLFAVSVLITLVVLIAGAFYFRSVERTFADII